MVEKEHWLLSALNHFKFMKSISEQNLKRDEKELSDRERLAKERGITKPIIIPEGYLDRDKQLKEQIECSKKQIEEYEGIIRDVHKASYFTQ